MGRSQQNATNWVSPVPYIRRLVVTGFDNPAILHGFFGDEYVKGVMPHVECERRNYLFAAKHGGWRSCKKQYDSGSGGGGGEGDESVPFMKPMGRVEAQELDAADSEWSRWLAFEDWMVGPRGVEEDEREGGKRGQKERVGERRGDGGMVDGVDGVHVGNGRESMDERSRSNGMVDGYGPR